jgi:CRISPR-associated protein Cas1
VKSGDSDNREGLAARIYWNCLFGNDFIRDRNLPGINALLNYGYTILRSATARALMGSGLLPSIGIFHHNRSNAFPLADDILEPYRPYVDEIVYRMHHEGMIELNREAKASLLHILTCDTHFAKIIRPLSVALTMTAASLVKCYTKELDKINYPLMKI